MNFFAPLYFLSQPIPPQPDTSSYSFFNFALIAFIVILAYQFFTTLTLNKKLDEALRGHGGEVHGVETPSDLPAPDAVTFAPDKILKKLENKAQLFLDIWEPGSPALGLAASSAPELLELLAANLIKSQKKQFVILATPYLGAEKLARRLFNLESEPEAQKRNKIKAYEKTLFLAAEYPLSLLDIYRQLLQIRENFDRGCVILELKALEIGDPEHLNLLLRDLKRLAHRLGITILLLSDEPQGSSWLDFSLGLSSPAPDSLLIKQGEKESKFKIHPQSGEIYQGTVL